jgi:hypothetical protein
MTLTRLLSLRVDFRDEAAGAAITPEQANAYLTARGWYRGDIEHWVVAGSEKVWPDPAR